MVDFPGGSDGKEPACQCRRSKRHRFDPWVRKMSWRRKWQPTPVSLPGSSHGQRSPVGYSPWGHKRVSDLATKQQQITLSLFGSFLIEGSGWMLERQSFSPKSVHKLRNNVPEHKKKGLLRTYEFWWNSPGNYKYIQPLGTYWVHWVPSISVAFTALSFLMTSQIKLMHNK